VGIEVGLSRTKLVERLRVERDPEVLGAFIDHRAWQVRWEAIESLGKSESPAAERYLLKVLATTSDKADLPIANAALGRVGSRAAIPALAALIHHPVEDVKVSAIHALGELGDSTLTPLYLDALSDRSWVAKWSAMGAIHRNGDERAIGPVVDRLRTLLNRERRTTVGGWTEPMYALDFLKRWQAVDASAGDTIEWVRSKRLDRLQPDERDWFASTFGP
jgi:HEAT repeat protein